MDRTFRDYLQKNKPIDQAPLSQKCAYCHKGPSTGDTLYRLNVLSKSRSPWVCRDHVRRRNRTSL